MPFILGDGELERVWGYCKVTANPTNGGIVLYAQVSSTQSLLVFSPTLIHIAAGTISNNEAAAISSALMPYSNICSAGQLCTPSGPTGTGLIGLTAGVIPEASNTFPFVVNSSPQLDIGLTHSLGLTFAGTGGIWAPNGIVTAAGFTATGFSAGTFCLHSVNGVISTTVGDCSTGGTVTSVGQTVPSWLTVSGSPILTAGTLAITAATGQTSHQVIGTCNTLTSFQPCSLVPGDIPTLNQSTTGNAATATLAANSTAWGGVSLSGVAVSGQCPIASSSSAAAWGACGSGGGSSFTGMITNGVAYATSSTGGTSSGAPAINGQYVFGANVIGGVSVPPAFSLVGLTGGTIGGASATYTTTYADNESVITHLLSGTVSVTLTLSTPTTVLNTNPVYSYTNHSSHNDTIATAGGFTIQSGSSAAASTLTVNSGVECRIIIDPTNPTTNWLADCRPNGGAGSVAFSSVTSGTSTGTLLVGTGGSLGLTGTGTINANILNGVTLSGAATTGNCMVATSSSAADWGSCAGLSLPATVGGTVTSGGILSFTSTTTAASSALLALGHVMLGGGAGATPTTDANLDDGQTLLNQLTYAGTAGIKASQGGLIAGLNGGVSEPFVLQEGTAPPSSGAQDRCYGDSTFHWLLCSMNNGSYNQMVVSSSTSSTSGDLVTYSGAGGNTVQDSNITGANVVLAAAPAASAKQVCTATANSSKTCSYIDFPEVFEFPIANVNGSNAGNGWSINTTCGALPAIYARTGTNLATGYLQFSASESACTQFELPADWDTATNPYIRVNYTQNGSTSSQSIIYTIQVGCSTTTDDAAFATAQTFSTTTTGATANTPYTQTLQLNSTSMTACTGGNMMNLKVSTAAGSSAVTNLQMVSLTVPRLITVQAN